MSRPIRWGLLLACADILVALTAIALAELGFPIVPFAILDAFATVIQVPGIILATPLIVWFGNRLPGLVGSLLLAAGALFWFTIGAAFGEAWDRYRARRPKVV